MKNFTKKSILPKTIIAILVVLLLSNFIMPTIIIASDTTEENETLKDVGGVLFKPIQYLVTGLGDTILWLANSCAYGTTVDPILTLSTSTMTWYEKLFAVIELAGAAAMTSHTGVYVPADLRNKW